MSNKKDREIQFISDKGYRIEVENLRRNKVPHTLTITNYTITIETQHSKTVYLKKQQSKQLFAAYAKIKSDVMKVKRKPDVKKADVNYFGCNGFRQDFFFNVHNLDLKAAYANQLHLSKMISEKTFSYLMQIPKMDRLAAVGMLASRKNIFYYGKDGKIDGHEIVESDLQNFFWYAVDRTYIKMKALEKMAGKHFLFSWVDGIYFNGGDDLVSELSFWIEQAGLNYSYEQYQTAEIKEKESHWIVTLEKDSEIKPFNIPKPERLLNKIFHEIIKQKYK